MREIRAQDYDSQMGNYKIWPINVLCIYYRLKKPFFTNEISVERKIKVKNPKKREKDLGGF